jgi:molecular chaperone GrpE
MSEKAKEASQPQENAEAHGGPTAESTSPDSSTPQPESSSADQETRDEELERLRSEVGQAEKRVLLAQAEAENFRKRMRRDMEDQLRFAALPLVADILEVRDNLVRALSAAEHAADSAGLQEGVAMVAKQLDDTLAKYSVQEIPALGEAFDPNCHEAISQMPSDEHPSGTVTHVAQSGFRMHDRVVRPSQVVVSSGPAGS